MNTAKKLQYRRVAILLFMITSIGVLFSGCSRDIVFPTSEVVPAAEAVVDIDDMENGNYQVDLKVKNLAAPERLTPSRRSYVVWMVTRKNGTINLGNLSLNRKNKAELETLTPYEPMRIFITAEDGKQVLTPSTQKVLDSGEFRH